MIKKDLRFKMVDSKYIDVYGLTITPDELRVFSYTKNLDGSLRFYVDRSDVLYLLLLRLDCINVVDPLDKEGNIKC